MREPETLVFSDDGGFPNSAWPVLLYRDVLAPEPASQEQCFASHGWGGAWRNGIYDFHHFHSTAHEVLGIARGHVQVMLGGPSGSEFRLSAGDCVVLPAGTGHCNRGGSADLLVVGATPDGTRWDLCRGEPAQYEAALRAIAAARYPAGDPVFGPAGALLRLWR